MKMVIRNYLPTLKIGQFHRLLKKIEPNQTLALAQMKVEGKDCTIKVNPTLFCAQTGELSIEFKWQDKDGKECAQTFDIIKVEMNGLKWAKSHRYLFVSNGNNAWNLYYHEGKFKSRVEFKNNNKTDGLSKTKTCLNIIQEGSPYKKKNGIRFKNGKLTEYGRKCVRYEIAQLKLIKSLYGELTKTQEENLKSLSEMMKGVSREKKK